MLFHWKKKKKNNEIELNTLIACSSVKFPDRQKSRNENKVNAVSSSESNTIFGTHLLKGLIYWIK